MTTTVTFSGDGATSVTPDLTIEYGTTPEQFARSVTLPQKEYAQFLGYYTKDDVRYFDAKGYLLKTWDIAETKVVLYAHWQQNLTREIALNGNGGSVDSKTFSVTIGEAYGELPTATWPDHKKAFAGWATNLTTEALIAATDIVPEIYPQTFYARWTNATYTIRFNGNGHTAGSMDDQTVEFNVSTNLSANAFERTGYAFAGWATTEDAAKVAYADEASVKDLASAANATVDLYVVWTANVYTVTFDANGGEGTMPTLTNSYDVAFALPENVFTRPAADFVKFDHWLDEATGRTYADGATVSNLTATADGTVTLKAVWASTLSDLSAAMHCTSLNWENYNSNLAWEKHEGTNVGYGSNSCARPASDGTGQCMVTEIAGETSGSDDSVLAFVKGTLSFWWKPASAEAQIQIGLSDQMTKTPTSANLTVIQAQGTDWTNVQFRIDYESPTTKKCAVFVINDSVASDGNYNCVDQMTWTAGEAEDEHPEPTEADAVTISSLTATDGGFTLTYTGDEKFAYRVLYTDSLASPITWLPYGSLTNDTGTSSSQTFTLSRDASVPMRFFMVETIRRP